MVCARVTMAVRGDGLGKSMSLRFSELGANVTIAARNKERLDETAKEIHAKTGGKVLTVETNVKELAA